MFEKVRTEEGGWGVGWGVVGVNATSGHLGALVAQRIPFTFLSCALSRGLVAARCFSPPFPSATGLDYITMHSLTHLLPCASFPADG